MRFIATLISLTAAFGYAQEQSFFESFELDTTGESHSNFLSEHPMHDDFFEEVMAETVDSDFGRALQSQQIKNDINMLKQKTAKMKPDDRRKTLMDYYNKFTKKQAEDTKKINESALSPAEKQGLLQVMEVDKKSLKLYMAIVFSNPAWIATPVQGKDSRVTKGPAGGKSTSYWYTNGAFGSGIVGFVQQIGPIDYLERSVMQTWIEFEGASADGKKNAYVISNMHANPRKKELRNIGNHAGCGNIKDFGRKGSMGVYLENPKKLSKAGCPLKIAGKVTGDKKGGKANYKSVVNFGILDPARYGAFPAMKNKNVLKASNKIKTRHGYVYYKSGARSQILDTWSSSNFMVMLDAAYALPTVITTSVAALALTQF